MIDFSAFYALTSSYQQITKKAGKLKKTCHSYDEEGITI